MRLDYVTDAGAGPRATLGLVVLATDETLEQDFARLTALPGVARHHTRIPMVPEVAPDTLAAMERALPQAAGLLPRAARFDVVGYGCTSGTAVIGPAAVRDAIGRVVPGARVTDPFSALVAAARALSAARIGLVTPYTAAVTERLATALGAEGVAVARAASFEQSDDRIVARIAETSILDAIRQIAAPGGIDAVVLSCTNLRSLGVIAPAEAEIGVPVLSSNLALIWNMLRLAGLDDARPLDTHLFRAA